MLTLILFIFVIIIIIILYLIYYCEIPRYMSMNKKGWEHVICLDSKYDKLPRVKHKKRIVISMTTIPSRFNKIAPTLCSVLSQSRRVDEIRLNIPYKSLKGDKYKIPKSILKLKYVKIHRVEKDLGPSTKLLPTLDYEPDSTIIVIDDDMIYGSELVRKLTDVFNKQKQKDVITNYGCNSKDGKFTRMNKYLWGDGYVYLLFGCGGYILNANMVPPDVFNYERGPKQAVFVDDNWISGWLHMNGIKVRTLGFSKGTLYIPNRTTNGTTALCDTVNENKSNNYIVDRWFEKLGQERYQRK